MGRRGEEATPQELTDAIGQLHAARCAIERAMLELVGEADRRAIWRLDGATSMATWLCAQLGLAYRTAADWVEVAGRLEELPALAETYAEGRLSHDQTRAASRLATPATDVAVAGEAPGRSAAELESAARRARGVSPEEARDDRDRRALRLSWDGDQRFLRLTGRLPAPQGAVVETALERVAAQAPRNPESGLFDPWEARMADALTELASGRLGADPDPGRATVVVHADLGMLAGGDGAAHLEGGPALTRDEAMRLACDARVETVHWGSGGAAIGIGRATRRIPPWLGRQLQRRDQGCRFPGCGRRRWIHFHHQVHWAEGGRTDSDNLCGLCPFHHWLVHEGGWRIEGDPNGEIRLIRPDGRPYRPRPPHLRREVAERVVEPVLSRFARAPACLDSS